MGAVWLVFGAEFRRRWRSWLILSVLIALVGGLVLAADATGRRTANAYPRFVATHGFDAGVFSFQPLPGLAKLPEVASVAALSSPANGQPTCACTHPINTTTGSFSLSAIAPADLARFAKVVAGTVPDPSSPDQVLASFTMQHDQGVHVGTVIHVPLYSASQYDALQSASGAQPTPTGPTVDLRVVGIAAVETDFPSGGSPSYDLYGSPAMVRALGSRVILASVYLVRLRHGAHDIPRFTLDSSAAGAAYTFNADASAASSEASIHPQAVGWWVLAVLTALVGLAVVGQALGRQSMVEGEEYPTLASLGLQPRQLVLLGTARNLAVAVAGAVGAVALATALSPLTPVGEARLAESSPGISLDPLVVPLGAAGIVVVVLLLGLWPSVRAARVRDTEVAAGDHRPSTIVNGLSAAGAPPSAIIGVRHALVRGRGRSTVPAGIAMTGMVLAVTALCATAVFGASLSHLTATPALFGDPYQVQVSPPEGGQIPAYVAAIEHDQGIGRITLGTAQQIFVDKVGVTVLAGAAIRGRLLATPVEGHFPTGPDEIALGSTTMRQLGAHLGSIVKVTAPVVSGGTNTTPVRVVGKVTIAGDIGTGGFGTGAGMTLDGYLDASCPPGPTRSDCKAQTGQNLPYTLLVSGVPGRRGQAAIGHLFAVDSSIAHGPIIPTSLVNFGEAVDFPLILGGVLVVFGAATLVHLLVVSVARRRRETGLLKALGFVNSQVGAAVCWQATTVAGVGILVGVPLGAAVGQVVWRAFASNLGVLPVPTVPVWAIAVLAIGALVTTNLLAMAPAIAAARSKSAGQLLRTQ